MTLGGYPTRDYTDWLWRREVFLSAICTLVSINPELEEEIRGNTGAFSFGGSCAYVVIATGAVRIASPHCGRANVFRNALWERVLTSQTAIERR